MDTDEQRIVIIQGKLFIRKPLRHGGVQCLVIPEERPEDWYVMPFPSMEVMMEYAKQHGFMIIRKD